MVKTSPDTATIRLDVDGTRVAIPVRREVKAYFDTQFVRSDRRSKIQEQKYATIMALMRAAYRAGRGTAQT